MKQKYILLSLLCGY